jgi:hypothetical protein
LISGIVVVQGERRPVAAGSLRTSLPIRAGEEEQQTDTPSHKNPEGLVHALRILRPVAYFSVPAISEDAAASFSGDF